MISTGLAFSNSGVCSSSAPTATSSKKGPGWLIEKAEMERRYPLRPKPTRSTNARGKKIDDARALVFTRSSNRWATRSAQTGLKVVVGARNGAPYTGISVQRSGNSVPKSFVDEGRTQRARNAQRRGRLQKHRSMPSKARVVAESADIRDRARRRCRLADRDRRGQARPSTATS